MKDKDADVRADAARRLVLLGVKAKTASPALIEALRDSDSKVRHRSVMALQKLWFWVEPNPEAEAAVPALAALLKYATPDDPAWLNHLGYFLVEQNKKLPEALQMIQRAVAAQPTNSIFLHSFAWAYFKLGRFDEAQRYLKESVEQEPESVLSQEHLGDVYARQAKVAEAHAAWKKTLSLAADESSKSRITRKLNGTFRE